MSVQKDVLLLVDIQDGFLELSSLGTPNYLANVINIIEQNSHLQVVCLTYADEGEVPEELRNALPPTTIYVEKTEMGGGCAVLDALIEDEVFPDEFLVVGGFFAACVATTAYQLAATHDVTIDLDGVFFDRHPLWRARDEDGRFYAMRELVRAFQDRGVRLTWGKPTQELLHLAYDRATFDELCTVQPVEA